MAETAGAPASAGSATPAYDALVGHHARLHDLGHLQAVATWDRLTQMPPGGAPARGRAQAALAVLMKDMQASPQVQAWLQAAAQEPVAGDAARNLARMQQAARLERAVPVSLAQRKELVTSAAAAAWAKARGGGAAEAAAAWQAFEPVVAVMREVGQRVGDELGLAPMDALLERVEPGLRLARIQPLFDAVQAWLPPLLQRTLARQATEPPALQPQGSFPVGAQQALGRQVMARLGFDFDAGRLDTSLHPFTGGVPEDVRLATRYDETSPLPGLIGTVHETGHACYQQNLPRAWLGQPLGGPHSASLHEGQALCFERFVLPSRAACTALAGWLAGQFGPQPAFEADNLVRLLRQVRPGRVRVTADPLSYPLHIVLRLQVEEALVDRRIEVADMAAYWHDGMRRLLDVDAAGPFTEGPLQDPHWVQGMFGYFPSYLLGAMVAAQCHAALRQDLPELDARLAAGDWRAPGEWLKARIWQQGARYDLDETVEQATGAPLGDAALRHHLEQRHGVGN